MSDFGFRAESWNPLLLLMNVHVNLASQQFRRDRPLLIGSAVAGVLLLGLLCMLVWLNLAERGRLTATRAEIDRLDRQLRSVATEQAKLEAVLRKPENAQVLDYSVLINSLLYRKGISWTQIFADLEKVLPHNVRVISIRPALNAQNQIVLEMDVGAEQTPQLLELLIKLENSDKFGHTAVSSILPPSQSEPLYRYKVNVNYAQKL
jgi:Tfp pilus assembly protein PilN